MALLDSQQRISSNHAAQVFELARKVIPPVARAVLEHGPIVLATAAIIFEGSKYSLIKSRIVRPSKKNGIGAPEIVSDVMKGNGEIPKEGVGSYSVPNELARQAEERAKKQGIIVNYGRKVKQRGRLFRRR